MRSFKNASIESKLLITKLISGIPIFLVFAYFIVAQYEDKHKEAQREVLRAVQSVSFEHSSQVEGIRNLLVALSQYPEPLLKDKEGCAKILNLILEQSPSSLNVGVVDKQGRIIAMGLKQPRSANISVADRKYFQDAVRTQKFSTGEFTYSRALKKPTPTFHFAQPVLDRAGNVELVLYAALDLNRFKKIFDAQHLPNGSLVTITDHKGTVMFRYPADDNGAMLGTVDKVDLRREMTEAWEEGMFTGTGLDGTRRQYAFKRLRLSPDDPPYLYLRVSIPEEVINENTTRILLFSVAAILVAAVASYFLTTFTARLYIISPIKQLVDASKRVEHGDLTARSGLAYTVDEIGKMAKSFDAMTLSLDERLREISLAESEKHRLAYYDPLTNLPNRRLMQDRLSLALKRSRRQGTSVALLYIDLDNFKHVNDTLGHSGGDQLLAVVAAKYASVLREDDIVCRLGGDEFAVILHDIQRDRDVIMVVEKLLKATTAPLVLDGKEVNVSASIGVALYPKDADDASTLEKNADIALYHAKDEGKNTFRMFSEELNRLSHERITLTNSLRHVVERNELVLHYQPKLSLKTGRVTGVEALLRWNCPEAGMVYPKKFITIAEESKMIIPIGEWVLRNACAQQVAWKKQGLELTMAVNISAVQFKSPHLVQSIKSILEETGISPAQLELELTESCLVNNPQETIRTLQKLRGLKCSIAIDDFGTGYSSLSYLKNFPVNILKIDRVFVKDLAHNAGDRAIAQSVVDLAKNLHLVTVAEGVESSEQQEILQEIGCGYVQGFLHCKALPPELIPDVVREKTDSC